MKACLLGPQIRRVPRFLINIFQIDSSFIDNLFGPSVREVESNTCPASGGKDGAVCWSSVCLRIKASSAPCLQGNRDDGGCYQTQKSGEGKVTRKLAGKGHKVMVFLGIRKHTARSCFNVTLPRWIKHGEWCCTKRSSSHTAWAFPLRDSLRLVGEKLKFNII